MRRNYGIVFGVATVLILVMAGCAGTGTPAASTASTPSAATGGNAAAAAGGSTDYTSAALPTEYENAVPASTQLALGTLRLEGTAQAVTPAQAKTLVPLWQALQGNALQNQAERTAVLKQIEGALTTDQLKAIATMQLTQDDIRKWMEEHGPGPGTPFPGGRPDGQGGGFGNMTEEQRAAFRATAEASGQGGPPSGGFGNMTEEERASFRATAQASGQSGQFFRGGQGQAPGARGTPGARATPGPGGPVRSFASYRMFAAALVQMLTERAGQ